MSEDNPPTLISAAIKKLIEDEKHTPTLKCDVCKKRYPRRAMVNTDTDGIYWCLACSEELNP